MSLTWKDGVATLLTAAIVALYVAFLADAGLPLVSGPRALAAVTLVLGLTACALGGGGAYAQAHRGYVGVLSTVGGIALVVGLLTVITGSEYLLAVLVGATVALWLVATVRHLVARGEVAAAGPTREREPA